MTRVGIYGAWAALLVGLVLALTGCPEVQLRPGVESVQAGSVTTVTEIQLPDAPRPQPQPTTVKRTRPVPPCEPQPPSILDEIRPGELFSVENTPQLGSFDDPPAVLVQQAVPVVQASDMVGCEVIAPPGGAVINGVAYPPGTKIKITQTVVGPSGQSRGPELRASGGDASKTAVGFDSKAQQVRLPDVKTDEMQSRGGSARGPTIGLEASWVVEHKNLVFYFLGFAFIAVGVLLMIKFPALGLHWPCIAIGLVAVAIGMAVNAPAWVTLVVVGGGVAVIIGYFLWQAKSKATTTAALTHVVAAVEAVPPTSSTQVTDLVGQANAVNATETSVRAVIDRIKASAEFRWISQMLKETAVESVPAVALVAAPPVAPVVASVASPAPQPGGVTVQLNPGSTAQVSA
jgi:hypothetical protein